MIKSINKESDVAIRVLKFISRKQKMVTVKELQQELNLPRPFLRKILQILAKKGFLISKKGKYGGFILAEKPEKIFIMDIINIFQKGLNFLNCIDENGNKCKEINVCKLRKILIRLELIVKNEFLRTNIYNL